MTTFLIFVFCSSCGPAYINLKTPIKHTALLHSQEPAIYVENFEDARSYCEVGRGKIFLGLVKTKAYAKEGIEIGKLVSDVFVDVLRKNNFNAVKSKISKPAIGKHDLLIKGKVIDYLVKAPYWILFIPCTFQFDMMITIENYEGKMIITKEYAKIYKSRLPHLKEAMDDFGYGSGYYVTLDIELRNLCEEIINDEEFKRAVTVLGTVSDEDSIL